MNKQVALVGLFGIAGVTLLLTPGAFDALFALFFVGMIPLVNFTVPPNIMLGLYALLIALGIRWILLQSVLIATKKRDQLARKKARKNVLKTTAKNPVTTKSVRKSTATSIRRRKQQAVKQAS